MARKLKHKPDLKVVLVGAKSVGKTCLLRRYLDRKYVESESTLGASFVLKLWHSYSVAIWVDTAGEERFAGLSSFYCRGAGAAILAFDPTDKTSFDALEAIFIPLLDAAREDCLKVVVGTKFDIVDSNSRKVSNRDAVTLARALNPSATASPGDIAYFETSSLTGSNVDEAFEYIFDRVLMANGDEKKFEVDDALVLKSYDSHGRCNKR
uniref:Uncharacterized protein n=1 Tax=Strigamia maritima TaxID=126957 RepID=T1JCY4_STRMM